MAPSLCAWFAICSLGHVLEAKPGTGVYKSTYAASDPLGNTKPWLLRYFPVYSANNSCDNGRETCACGATGRMEVNGTTGFEPEFGIHTVLAAGRDGVRAKASGEFSVAEIEAIWTEEIGDLSEEHRGYDGWLDNHLALWTPCLGSFLQRFEADGLPFMARSWMDQGSQLYSVIVHAPKTQLVLELISNSTGGKGSWPLQPEPRHLFQGQAPPATQLGYLSPLHVSRSVRSLEEIQDFYGKVLEARPTVQRRFEDGTELLVFGGVPTDTFSPRVGLQFVKRAPGASRRKHSSVWFQDYMLNVSNTYMTSYNSCWPVWGDNHIAVSVPLGLDVLKDRLDALDHPMYHAFHGIHDSSSPSDFGGPSVIYVVDPSGWTVQMETPGFQWPDGFLPDADTDQGNFYEYCGDPRLPLCSGSRTFV